jgi:hypothetical protein
MADAGLVVDDEDTRNVSGHGRIVVLASWKRLRRTCELY